MIQWLTRNLPDFNGRRQRVKSPGARDKVHIIRRLQKCTGDRSGCPFWGRLNAEGEGLFHNHYRGLPKGRLLGAWIENRHLAIVFARLQLAQRDAEFQRNRF